MIQVAVNVFVQVLTAVVDMAVATTIGTGFFLFVNHASHCLVLDFGQQFGRNLMSGQESGGTSLWFVSRVLRGCAPADELLGISLRAIIHSLGWWWP